jgi:hypothetical protein
MSRAIHFRAAGPQASAGTLFCACFRGAQQPSSLSANAVNTAVVFWSHFRDLEFGREKWNPVFPKKTNSNKRTIESVWFNLNPADSPDRNPFLKTIDG